MARARPGGHHHHGLSVPLGNATGSRTLYVRFARATICVGFTNRSASSSQISVVAI
jgi:hypothetical protein